MSKPKDFWKEKWLEFKADLKRRHPEWDDERISRAAARKIERAKKAVA